VKRALEQGGPGTVRSLDRGPGIGVLEVNAGKPWSHTEIDDLRQSAASK
jgi:hypothetical protein